jgi:hypothetical protein
MPGDKAALVYGVSFYCAQGLLIDSEPDFDGDRPVGDGVIVNMVAGAY